VREGMVELILFPSHLEAVPALAVTVAVAEIVQHLALRMGKIF
jgi:hypothetical protein